MDKENTVLRAIVGNPNRHKPLADHSPPTTTISPEKSPATMYTLETRYRSIPVNVLPTEPNGFFHIEPQNSKSRNQILPKEKTNTSTFVESKPPKIVREESPIVPNAVVESRLAPTPVLYTLVANKSNPTIPDDQPEPNQSKNVSDTTVNSPTLYSLIGETEFPVDVKEPVKTQTQPSISAPTLYSIVGKPELRVDVKEPVKTQTQPSISAPSLYSIVGKPDLTPQSKAIIHSPVKAVRSSPPTSTIKAENKNSTMYTLVGEPNPPEQVILDRKMKPRENSPPKLPQTSTFYVLVNQPKPPASIDLNNQSHRKTRPQGSFNKIPPIGDEHHSTMKGSSSDDMLSTVKTNRQIKAKEPSILESEKILFPFYDEERQAQPKKSRKTAYDSSPIRYNRNPHLLVHHDPLHLPNYQSPYAYHPQKVYRDSKEKPQSLPSIKNYHPEQKTRLPLHEPRHRIERRHPPEPDSYFNMERYPVDTRKRSRLWDYEYYAQTDIDDDDDDNNTDQTRQKRHRYRRIRPRLPWIPVW